MDYRLHSKETIFTSYSYVKFRVKLWPYQRIFEESFTLNFDYHTKLRLKLTHSSGARTVDFEEMMIPPHDPVAMLNSGLLGDGDSIQETSGSL